MNCSLVSYLRSLLLTQSHKDFCLFSSKSIIDTGFIFRPVMYFELIFVQESKQLLLLCIQTSNYSSTIDLKGCSFSTAVLLHLVKNQLSYKYEFRFGFYFVLLIYLLIIPIPCHFHQCSSITGLEIKQGQPSRFVLFQNCLGC